MAFFSTRSTMPAGTSPCARVAMVSPPCPCRAYDRPYQLWLGGIMQAYRKLTEIMRASAWRTRPFSGPGPQLLSEIHHRTQGSGFALQPTRLLADGFPILVQPDSGYL